MDSFYDAPRQPPPPIYGSTLAAVPVVPDLSVLCPSNGPRNNFLPYNQWRSQNPAVCNGFYGANKENLSAQEQNSSILKKQVRFESPVLQQKRQMQNEQPKGTQTIANFEQMYMANIPNRQLDLSIIDSPKKNVASSGGNSCAPAVDTARLATAPKQSPKSYREFVEAKRDTANLVLNDSVTDIFNYKRNNSSTSPAAYTRVNQFMTDIKPVEKTSNDRHTPETDAIEPQRKYAGNYDICLSKPQSYDDYRQFQFVHSTAGTNLHCITSDKPQELQREVKELTCDCNKKEEERALKIKSDDDFSAKELLKIIAQQGQQIAQQNSQILLLQQQVTQLLSLQTSNQKNIENDCQQTFRSSAGNILEGIKRTQDICTQEEFVAYKSRATETPRKHKNLKNFSIGLTTSVEVSFRRHQVQKQNNFLPQAQNLINFETEPVKIEEITENKNPIFKTNNEVAKETIGEQSIVFKDSVQVNEPCPSPDPSVNINMNEFEYSDSEDEANEAEDSFYKNLMPQVNRILQEAQIETAEGVAYNVMEHNLNNRTLNRVKEATLKHLRRIGVNVPNFEESLQSGSSDEVDGKSYKEEDISFAVKQLLMKYLPADHLAKVSVNREENINAKPPTSSKRKMGIIQNRPEFSFASLQYMKKYNLIAGNQQDGGQRQKQFPKILDITKLKQQPKLL